MEASAVACRYDDLRKVMSRISILNKNNLLKHLSSFFPLLLFFSLALVLQFLSGSLTNEFGVHSDEAGHYITGLMVRDYIASFQWTSPMQFAENYYIHYPKVALGHWPPFFYIVQALWTLIFSPSRLSLYLLMIFLVFLLAYVVCRVIRKDFGAGYGIVSGLLMLSFPLVQQYSGMIMAEILVALLGFFSVLYFGRFLDSESWKDSAWFGLFSSLTIMTKGNGLALALLPLLALLLNGRFSLLRKGSFWLSAGIVFVLCAPWHWFTMDMVRNGWLYDSPSMKYTSVAFFYYASHLLEMTGFALFFFIILGFFSKLFNPFKNQKVQGRWAASGALILSVLIFQSIVPGGLEPRHLIILAPALLMFFIAGISFVAEKLSVAGFSLRQKRMLLTAIAIFFFILETFTIPTKQFSGFGEIAQRLISAPAFQSSVIMVSSDTQGEGAFISEVAMREQRPGHIVLRASNILGQSRWDGGEYKALFNTSNEMMNYLQSIPVGFVVLEESIPSSDAVSHVRLLKEVLRSNPQSWELFGSYPMMRDSTKAPDSIKVYRLIGHENRPRGRIQIDMTGMLNKTIELK